MSSGIGFGGKVYACDSSRGAAKAFCLSIDLTTLYL